MAEFGGEGHGELEGHPTELDEEAIRRQQVRHMLALTAEQRLQGLRNAYPLFLAGQVRRGRRVMPAEDVVTSA